MPSSWRDRIAWIAPLIATGVYCVLQAAGVIHVYDGNAPDWLLNLAAAFAFLIAGVITLGGLITALRSRPNNSQNAARVIPDEVQFGSAFLAIVSISCVVALFQYYAFFRPEPFSRWWDILLIPLAIVSLGLVLLAWVAVAGAILKRLTGNFPRLKVESSLCVGHTIMLRLLWPRSLSDSQDIEVALRLIEERPSGQYQDKVVCYALFEDGHTGRLPRDGNLPICFELPEDLQSGNPTGNPPSYWSLAVSAGRLGTYRFLLNIVGHEMGDCP